MTRTRTTSGLLGAALAVLGMVIALVVVVPGAGSDEQADEPAAPPVGVATGPPGWDQVLQIRDELRADAASSDYPVDAAALASVATAPGPYTPLGRIAFPSTGLDVEFAAGVQPSVLERGPGHWPGTAAPGQPGNMVVSGHRTTFTKPFADLDVLRPGDQIAVTPTGAEPVTYLVSSTDIVPEAEYAEFVLRRPAGRDARELTLFACHPEGQRTHRIVVRASVAPPGEGS